MGDRLRDGLGFLLILATAIAGLAGGPAWLTLPASLALMLMGGLSATFGLKTRFEAVDRGDVFWLAVAAHWAQAFIACLAGFAMGLVVRWLWW